MTGQPIVYVDLDGTLSPSDVLLESCLLLLKRNVLYVFLLLWWALKGGWRLKTEVARRVTWHGQFFPLNREVVARLQSLKAQGHTLVLASASLARDVNQVAEQTGLFDRVLASTTHNLKGKAKLKAIQADAQGQPFAYFGDASVDVPIWTASSQAWAVNPSQAVQLKAKAAGVELNVIQTERPARFRSWLKAMRVQQWVKNGLLFVPLLAAHRADTQAWVTMLWGFVAFGLVASATYVWNDLMDLESDRQHPRKRLRPMASGVLPIHHALAGLAFLGLAGFAVSATLVGWAFTAVLAIYTVMTLLYTFVFKRTAFVDVLLLALLYTVRIVAGGVGTGIDLSSWLLAISLFLFLSLALVKRCAELEFLAQEGVDQPSGRGYRMDDLSYLVSMGISSGFVSVLVLALYVDSTNGSRLYATPEWLWGVCPLFLFWLMRIWILTARREMVDDPVHFALNDRVSWGFVLASGLLFVLAA